MSDDNMSGHARRGGKEPTSKRGKCRPADPAYLEKAALFYLQRFATSRAHLATVLSRKVERRGLPAGVSRDEAQAWIQAVVEKMAGLGYVDDAAYARGRARTLFQRGKPRRVIGRALAEKGVDETLIQAVLDEIAAETAAPDMYAAIRYVRRRRIGPARPEHRRRESADRQFQKDLAAMGRAGFSLEVAKTVLELNDEAALDDLENSIKAPDAPDAF